MWQLIILSVIFSTLTFFCILACGAWLHTAKEDDYDLFEGDAVFLFVITAVGICMSVLLLLKTGEAEVRTRELPTIERKVTLREQGGEIKSDTLYIFKFR